MMIHILNELKNIDHGFVSFRDENRPDINRDGYSSRNIEFAIQGSRNVVNMNQKHTNNIVIIDKSPVFEGNKVYHAGICDGLFTTIKDVTLVVNTADCVPILLTDKNRSFCAVVHSGWRGAMSGINEKMIDIISSYAVNMSDVIAIIGPCIHQESYEVGFDLFNEFDKTVYGIKYFTQSLDKYMFNLRGLVCDIYKGYWLNVYDININTYTSKEFDSYRKNTHEPYHGYCPFASFISI